MRRGGAVIVAAVLALGGCASSSGGPTMPSTPPLEPSVTPSGAPSSSPTPGQASLSTTRWQALRDDLVARDVTGEPTVVSVENVRFSDASLGCPQPGRQYSQALVNGQRAIVEVDGVRYDYRFGNGDRPRLCANP